MATPHILYVRILLFLIVLAGGVCFAISLLFPNQTITFDFQSPDALKNTISDPRLSEIEVMENGNVPDSQTVTANAGLLGMHDTATITFTLANDSLLPERSAVSLQKGYRTFFLPLIDNPVEDVIGNVLVSHANVVYVLTEDKRYPITDATLVDALGYTWDDVVPADSETLARYEKQKMFTLSSGHPDGTLFKTERDTKTATGTLYTVHDGKLYRCNNCDGSTVTNEHAPIQVDAASRERIAMCMLQKKLSLFKKKLSCSVEVSALQETIGNNYQFSFSFDRDIKLEAMTIVFHAKRSEKTLRETGVLIKKRILQRFYDGEL